MLTPQEIAGKAFVKAIFGGYDMTGVDNFLESVAADYAALYKENAILKGKIKVLVEKVEEYRSTEDSMRMALLTAQRMGEDIMADANRRREEALKSTDAEVAAKLRDLNNALADQKARLEAATAETRKFVEVSQELIRRYNMFLTNIDAVKRAPEPDPEPVPEPTREEKIMSAAEEIGNAVEKIVSTSETPEASLFEPDFNDEGEPTKPFVTKSEEKAAASAEEEEAFFTPRPKFDFENLKFGVNFTSEE